MATTGTFDFDPKLAEIIEESSERAGIDPGSLGQSHLKSIFRSLKFMLGSEWATLGIRQWMIYQVEETLIVGQTEFNLPTGAIDVIAAVLRRQDQDTEMNMISRNEYLTIVDKTNQGRPDRFYVDRKSGTKRFVFWQASENTTDKIIYDLFKNIEDVGNMSNNPQVPTYALDALCEGLAAAMARKFNQPAYAALQLSYKGQNPDKIGGKLGLLLMEDRERGDIQTYAKFEPRTSRY